MIILKPKRLNITENNHVILIIKSYTHNVLIFSIN